MKVKALDTLETTRFIPEEDEHGIITTRAETIRMKEGEVADLDDKLAKRLIGYGHASDDLTAETRSERAKREAAEAAAATTPAAPTA